MAQPILAEAKVVDVHAETSTMPPASEGVASLAEITALLTPTDRSDAIGRLGHYEVQAIIGHGGMGVVLRAFDTKLHRMVALKCLHRAVASTGEARKRFIREAKAAAAINHDNVVAIHAVEDTGDVPYLVMQYIEGQSLEQKIQKEGSLELKEILRISMQIARGLTAAHRQGLVHRDVKPANILLENGVQRVKLSDFGLARAVDDVSVTQTGVITGTPLFMSPEQAEGKVVDHRSDLFSLGSVMYAMCTGRAPFRASGTLATLRRVCEAHPRPIRELNPEIPEWLCTIIARLHAKNPAERFPSAHEVADVLEQCLAQVQQNPGQALDLASTIPALQDAKPRNIAQPTQTRVQTWSKETIRRVVALIVIVIVVLFLLKYREWLAYPIKWFFFSDVAYYVNEDDCEVRIWKLNPNPLLAPPEPSQVPGSDRFPIHLPGERPVYTLSSSKDSMGRSRWEPGTYAVYVAKKAQFLDLFHFRVEWNQPAELQIGSKQAAADDCKRLQGTWYAKSIRYRQGPALGVEALPLSRLKISDQRMHWRLPSMDASCDFSVYVGHNRRFMVLNARSQTSTFILNQPVEYQFQGSELHVYLHDPQPQVTAEHYRKQGLPVPVPANAGLVIQWVQQAPKGLPDNP